MNSFTLHAVGQLASDPEFTIGKVRIPRDGEQGFHGIVNTDSRGR